MPDQLAQQASKRVGDQVVRKKGGGLIGKFRITGLPWDEHDWEANASQLLCKKKTNIGNLLLSRWKTIEILKTVRFQSLNFTSKPKGYLLQTKNRGNI